MAQAEKKQPRTRFFDGVKAEFRKVEWPNRQATFKQSVAVVLISVVVGVVIAVIDFLAQNGVNWFTSL